MDPYFKDLAQTIFWIASPVTLMVGIVKYIKDNIYKHKWDKAKFTKETIDGLVKNDKAILATYMLGAYEYKKYDIVEDGKITPTAITQQDVIDALNSTVVPTNVQIFVRDCIDNLLFDLEQIFLSESNDILDSSLLQPLVATFFVGIKSDLKDALIAHSLKLGYSLASEKLEHIIGNNVEKTNAFYSRDLP